MREAGLPGKGIGLPNAAGKCPLRAGDADNERDGEGILAE